MKISFSNYPILETLYRGEFGKMPMARTDKEFLDSFDWILLYQQWKDNAKEYRHTINVISEPFALAARKAEQKLNQLYQSIIDEKKIGLEFCEVFIEPGGFVYMLKFKLVKGKPILDYLLYWFHPIGHMLGCAATVVYHPKNFSWISKSYLDHFAIENQEEEVMSIVIRLLNVVLFKKYAEVETKEIPANSRPLINDERYINDTRLNVTYLDSKWFTNLVKSESFNVRGHFKMQACGENLCSHKLIYVDTYVKSGYTAPARKLKEEQ